MKSVQELEDKLMKILLDRYSESENLYKTQLLMRYKTAVKRERDLLYSGLLQKAKSYMEMPSCNDFLPHVEHVERGLKK